MLPATLERLFHGPLQYTANPKFMYKMLISQYREMYLEWGGACNRLVGKLVWELQISVGKSNGRKEST